MRRPRTKLQVSTFPFLAVLLCAMGSLLLFLFIMDRRAKIAARYRVAEELKVREKRSQEEEAKRQAHWEKARQALHQSLLDQQAQMLDKTKGMQNELDAAARKLALEQNKRGEIDQQVRDEAAKIVLLQLEIENQRTGLVQADQKEKKSKVELLEAAKELAELELAFRQLRALKDREKDVYSVVPYRGKRGDTRTPIYVECVRDGVFIHPNVKLFGWDCTSGNIRGEIERRNGPLSVQKAGKPDANAEPQGPYVLFLVRPDGIGSYYKAVSAVKGFELDYGYELVDAGWVLDFGATKIANSGSARPQQPWKHKDDVTPMFVPAPGGGQVKEGSPSFPIRPPNLAGGGGSIKPANVGPSSGGLPSHPDLGSGVPSKAGMPPVTRGSPLPPPSGFPTIGESGTPTRSGMPTLGIGVDTGIPKPPSFAPIAKNQPPVPIASAGGSNGGGTANKTGDGGQNSASEGGLNGTGDASKPNGKRQGSGELQPSTGTGNRPLTGLGSPEPNKTPASPPPLSKLVGNKDFLITIECRNDAVTITPGGFAYRWTASNLKATDDAVVQAVTNLIARRQASVRPGEPPYRPIICFHVSTEGLRTYYHVYPLLEPLRVTMTRENLAE